MAVSATCAASVVPASTIRGGAEARRPVGRAETIRSGRLPPEHERRGAGQAQHPRAVDVAHRDVDRGAEAVRAAVAARAPGARRPTTRSRGRRGPSRPGLRARAHRQPDAAPARRRQLERVGARLARPGQHRHRAGGPLRVERRLAGRRHVRRSSSGGRSRSIVCDCSALIARLGSGASRREGAVADVDASGASTAPDERSSTSGARRAGRRGRARRGPPRCGWRRRRRDHPSTMRSPLPARRGRRRGPGAGLGAIGAPAGVGRGRREQAAAAVSATRRRSMVPLQRIPMARGFALTPLSQCTPPWPAARRPQPVLPRARGAGARALARARRLRASRCAAARARRSWVFYEGPPTANGKPGAHHVLARVFKDIFPRYKTMRGYHVARKGGWDMPRPARRDRRSRRQLGLKCKTEIEAYGIEEFNQQCRESVFTYLEDWNRADRAHRLLARPRRRLPHARPDLRRVGLVGAEADLRQGPALRGPQGRPVLPALRHGAVLARGRAGLQGRRRPVGLRALPA